MFTSLQLFDQSDITCSNKPIKRACKTDNIKHTLKSKENIYHHKCRKELKKKLKKYRLRHDGEEDPEVLDVSKILVSLLKIKSPNHGENKLECTFGTELKPKNYLFKMGRRKPILSKKGVDDSNIVNLDDIAAAVDNTSTTSALKDKTEKVKKALIHSPEFIEKNENNDSSSKEHDKKQTNAFKLLMDSRNKSIGSNSPGKDKVDDELQTPEIIERRNTKVKRTLLLQKMAEAKGSLKNKEMEEHQEKIIKKKMEKRAERLKGLILNIESKPISKEKKSNSKGKESLKKEESKANNDKLLKTNKLHLVDLFPESKKLVDKAPDSKYVSKEDQDFFKKLSPSLKKRENMLCYFKKIEKDADIGNENFDDDDDIALIKVKVMKSKKKIKKKKLSLNKDNPCYDDAKVIDNSKILEKVLNKSKKTKVLKENDLSLDNLQKNNQNVATNKNNSDIDLLRPKRNVKRPAKYIDEVCISSSDEELHIFTPKKKKHSDSQNDSGRKITSEEIKPKHTKKSLPNPENKKELKVLETKSKKNVLVDCPQKKPAKLAPIFNAKPQIDTATLEAKQRFLSSGVPDKLKKVIEKQNNKSVIFNTFGTVVHVLQSEPSTVKSCDVDYDIDDSDDDFVFQVDGTNFFKKIKSHETLLNKFPNVNQAPKENDAQIVLQQIKKNYPKFPVYRTYRLLKDKSKGQYRDNGFLDLDNSIEVINGMIDLNVESPDKLNWTDKYKPLSSKEMIGNFEITKELKKWLISWTENDVKTKKYNSSDSDSSDFYHSDTDSKDSMKVTNNLLILNGPVGSGKTSIVYAVAAELAIKVLEVNASSRRTGKIMLQDLQEATQSHKVNRGKSSSSQEGSQKLQEVVQIEVLTKPKKRGRPKKSVANSLKKAESEPISETSSQPQASQDGTRTCMSLILIDDADIVFEQDDGFCSAIVQLVHCSKRPVILISSSTTCPHLQRFINTAKVLKTRSLQPRMLGTWLDIMCLVENNSWCPGLGAHVLSKFQGDIRKTINYLQFYFPKENFTAEGTVPQSNDLKINVEDESSSMSWSDREATEEKNDNTNFSTAGTLNQYFLTDNNSLLHFESPMKLFDLWWNVPKLLNKPLDGLQKDKTDNGTTSQDTIRNTELQAISNTLDAISLSDFYSKTKFVSDLTDSPWLSLEQDSVSEQQNLDNYSKYDIVTDEIAHELITGHIVYSQKSLGVYCDNKLECPKRNQIRERDKTISRHNILTDYLHSAAALDRRALALDYWSSCRSICRIEKSKTDTNSKRNNRYCHYLKSLNVLCNNDSLDSLSKSLCSHKEG